MKVLFLLKSDKTPSSRIRVLDMLPGLRENGIEPEVEFLPDSFWKRRELLRKAKDYPVTVLQKRLLSFLDFHELRRKAKCLIFDFDDAIYHRNASCSANPDDYLSSTRLGKFKRMVSGADMVIAANQVLARKAMDICCGITARIIPSPVDTANVVPKDSWNLGNPPVVGWIGTRSTLRYLDMIASALRTAARKREFVLRVISDRAYEMEGVRTESVRWSLEGQNDQIREFDVGIMPLSQDPFSEGKSAYKLLQYFSLGVPSVCSPVGMNAELAGNNINCLMAGAGNEFGDQIIRLLDDGVLREELGRKGRNLAERKFDRKVVAADFARALKEAPELRKT